MPQISPFRFTVAPVSALFLTVALMAAPPLPPATAQGSGTTLAPAASQQQPGFRVDAGKRVTADGTFPVADALSRLLKGSGESFILSAAAVGEVTLSLKDVPFETALKLILNASQTPLTCGREEGVYVITQQVPAKTDAALAGASEHDAVPTKRVTTISYSDSSNAVRTALALQIIDAEADLAEKRTAMSDDAPQIRQTLARLESLRKSLAEVERQSILISEQRLVKADAQTTSTALESLVMERGRLIRLGYLPTATKIKAVERQIAELEKQVKALKHPVR